MILYYNPDCSKCNSALSLLQQNNCEVEIRSYLQQPPTIEELKHLTHILACGPADITRKKENLFITEFEGELNCEEDWYAMLTNHPILIERPIVINGNEAIIGRPPEIVIKLLNNENSGFKRRTKTPIYYFFTNVLL